MLYSSSFGFDNLLYLLVANHNNANIVDIFNNRVVFEKELEKEICWKNKLAPRFQGQIRGF